MLSSCRRGVFALRHNPVTANGFRQMCARLADPSHSSRWPFTRIRLPQMTGFKASFALAVTAILCVFVADLVEPSDNVSICFAYTLPILLGVYIGPGSTFRLAALATVASLVGSFIRPPEGGIVLSFAVNRAIAVTAQWLIAFLIEQRRRNHAMIEARLVEERRLAETSRRFVQIMTHEIATALTSIDGQSYRLAKIAYRIEPSDIIARADKIRNAATRLKALVERVSLAAEVGRGEIMLTREPIDAAALFRPLVNEYEAACIQLDIRVTEPALCGDRALIYQAVSNLVANAIKYSQAPCAVQICISRSGLVDGNEITVADRGVGIAAEELDRVFEPYYRASNSGGIPGLGIGLYLVRSFVAAHGGQVHIESKLGLGTTVYLHIPEATP